VAAALGCGGSPLPPPRGLSYLTPSALYTEGIAIPVNLPTVTGAVSAWSTSPGLPAGLAIDPATGAITGTPVEPQPGLEYLVTASNARGSATAIVNITVWPAGDLTTRIVHFHDSAAWGAVNLSSSVDGIPGPVSPGSAMTAEGAGWFGATLPAGRAAAFAFNDGTTWIPLQGAAGFRTSAAEVWVKDGLLFTYRPDPGAVAPASELTVLTLNLHTYQEIGVADGGTQAAKLDRVADAIAALSADFVTLQECAQSASAAGITDARARLSASGTEVLRADNMAFLLSKRLKEVHGLTYEYAWSWAHYGFTSYEEGVAVLSRHPIDTFDSTYVSTSTSTGDPLGARKVVHLASTLPGGQVVNLFSAHLSFTGAEQDLQLDRLRAWMASKESNGAMASIVGGDFNMAGGSRGYLRMTSSAGGDPYVDSYWIANREGFGDATIEDGRRIDYLFFKRGQALTPMTGQLFFRIGDPSLGGRVSDHVGTVVRLGLTN
jgi:maltose 6'-phosphate phosphatase